MFDAREDRFTQVTILSKPLTKNVTERVGIPKTTGRTGVLRTSGERGIILGLSSELDLGALVGDEEYGGPFKGAFDATSSFMIDSSISESSVVGVLVFEVFDKDGNF